MERNVTKIKQHHLYCNHIQAGIIFSKRELCSSYQRVPEQFFLSRMIRAQKKKKKKKQNFQVRKFLVCYKLVA